MVASTVTQLSHEVSRLVCLNSVTCRWSARKNQVTSCVWPRCAAFTTVVFIKSVASRFKGCGAPSHVLGSVGTMADQLTEEHITVSTEGL